MLAVLKGDRRYETMIDTPRSMRPHRPASVLALALLLAAACAPAGPSQPSALSPQSSSAPKRIVAAIKGDPPTLSDAVNSAGAGGTDGLNEVEHIVHAGLAVVDGDGRLAPRLAEAVPSLENGLWRVLPDGRMETTFKIKPDARWHDGAPFTADDLVFTAGVAQDRQVSIVRDSAYESVESVEAVDAATVLVRWKGAYIEADSLFSSTPGSRVLPMPRHLLERAYAEDRAGLTQLAYWSVEFVGLGPYRLREWALGSHLVLEANDRYVLGRPRVDQIEIRFILDSTTMVANVLAGAVDVTLGRGLSLEQGLQARDQWPSGRMESTLAGWTALFPQFLGPNPPFVADLQFRRAVLHALDRQYLSDSLQAGLSPIAHSIIGPGEPEYAEIERSVVRYDYDPRRATALLESLGLIRGADGAVRDQAGQRIVLEVRTTRDDLRERLIHPVGDYWRQVGIGMDPVIIPTQAASDRQYRATFPAFELTRQPTDLRRYHGSGVPLPENSFRGNNRVRYVSQEYDTLFERYLSTIPRAERTQALGQIVQHMTDRLVTLGIFYTVEPSLVSSRLVNVAGRKGESSRQPWNVHEWDLR